MIQQFTHLYRYKWNTRFTCPCSILINTVDSRYLDFAYLEWPLISNWKSGPCLTWKSYNRKQNSVEKRRNCSSGAISSLFPNIFNSSLTSGVILLYIFISEMWLFDFIFSSILHSWYVEVWISRSISESPLDFEITRVDCIISKRSERQVCLGRPIGCVRKWDKVISLTRRLDLYLQYS